MHGTEIDRNIYSRRLTVLLYSLSSLQFEKSIQTAASNVACNVICYDSNWYAQWQRRGNSLVISQRSKADCV